MANAAAFFPTAPTSSIAASAVSANGAITNPERGESLRLFNDSTVKAFVKWGAGAQTSTTAEFPIAPNSVEVIRIPPSADNVAVILPSGTGTLYVTKGEGV